MVPSGDLLSDCDHDNILMMMMMLMIIKTKTTVKTTMKIKSTKKQLFKKIIETKKNLNVKLKQIFFLITPSLRG